MVLTALGMAASLLLGQQERPSGRDRPPSDPAPLFGQQDRPSERDRPSNDAAPLLYGHRERASDDPRTTTPGRESSLEELVERREPTQLEVGGRVEFRTGQPEGGTPALADLEVDPVLAFRGPLRTGSIALSYEPRIFITLDERGSTSRASYLHRGRLVFDVRPSPRWRFFIEGRGAYGEYDFLPLSTVIPDTGGTGLPPQQPTSPTAPPTAPNPTPGVGTLPDQRFLRVADLNASAGVVVSLSPTVSWLFSAGYIYSGGADVEARQVLPLQKGPQGVTGALWSVSQNDNLSFLLDASHTRFSSGPQATIGTMTTTWSHVWSRTVATDLIGGIGGFHAEVPAQGTAPGRTEDTLLPVGGLGLRHTALLRGASWRNSLTFLAAPLPDAINAFVYERLSAVLRSTFAPGEHLLLDVSGGASASVGVPQRDARIEGRATYMVTPHFGVSAGGRVAWLEGSPLLPTGFGWLCFFSVGAYAGSSLVGTGP